MKQYILIRTDKKFPIGKIMAHIGHNCLECYKAKVSYQSNMWYYWFREHDQTKIVLDGGSKGEIENIIRRAKKIRIPTSFIEDIHIYEKIVAVIGPIDKKQAEMLGLSKLKLYK